MKKIKNLEYYLNLPYCIEIYTLTNEEMSDLNMYRYYGYINEISHISGNSKDKDELIQILKNKLAEHFENYLDKKLDIVLPNKKLQFCYRLFDHKYNEFYKSSSGKRVIWKTLSGVINAKNSSNRDDLEIIKYRLQEVVDLN